MIELDAQLLLNHKEIEELKKIALDPKFATYLHNKAHDIKREVIPKLPYNTSRYRDNVKHMKDSLKVAKPKIKNIKIAEQKAKGWTVVMSFQNTKRYPYIVLAGFRRNISLANRRLKKFNGIPEQKIYFTYSNPQMEPYLLNKTIKRHAPEMVKELEQILAKGVEEIDAKNELQQSAPNELRYL
ncbi:hypothetical protein [[Mycoplasma] gypis]|uniref:Uncharacterized protein n=1 Tax=[Mycoplasma] gypis TaxID=92404 RepID=A0ABZ2RQD0_9BACT|nr:hypothetical protein [[Mycoplasma] gypis]MBN0919430.1 hypothetical protein [[Mycoplasma] gypis]